MTYSVLSFKAIERYLVLRGYGHVREVRDIFENAFLRRSL